MARAVTLPPDEPASADGIRPGGWWHDAPDGRRIVCDLCPRACSLGEEDRGFCFVRQNRSRQIVSTTYGRSTGCCIDPIEKKPLVQFYPGTSVLSFGTAGCNLGCKFCQNWSSSRSRQIDAASEVAAPETIARAAEQMGCRSVAFTYNDPVVWAEYAIDTARACRERGVKTVAVTAGYIQPEARKTLFEVMDAANVDLKGFSEDFYWRYSSGHLEPVLDTLRWLVRETSVWLEITNLVIPRANDSDDEIRRMCEWVLQELGPDVPLHFTAFHPDFHMTDREPTPHRTLVRAYDTARRAGLHYVYTGNVSDAGRESTYCPGCGKAVIERDGYELGRWALRDGCCASCGRRIAGHFDARPGTWGARRQPVPIGTFALPEREKVRKAPTMTSQSGPGPGGAGRPALSSEQEGHVFLGAAKRVTATVRGEPQPSLAGILGDAAGVPVYGAFVSLKRGGQLRSCCGYLSPSLRLGEAVEHAADRAAKDDPRFPPISPSELPHLDMEVWILWGLEPITVRGEDRVSAVQIGKHGLQVARGSNRGLLLPGVAVEHHFDAREFLEQVCHKAGLPPGAWKKDDTALWTFEGYAIHGRLGTTLEAAAAEPAPRPTPVEVARLAEFARENLVALDLGATPSFYLPGAFDDSVCGVALSVALPGVAGQNIECGTVSVRAEKPLQATLFDLARLVAGALRQRAVDPAAIPPGGVALTVLSDPVPHGTAQEADLAGVDPRRRAVLLADRVRTAWLYDPQKTPETLLAEALELGKFPDPAATAVLSVAVASTASRAGAAYRSQAADKPRVRAPAVAGTFYPGEPRELDRMLKQMLPAQPHPEPWAGAMVPHAGWIYSGRLAGATLARLQVPPQVIIFCPKHSRGGAEWAVAPHDVWSLPSGEVPSDPELARRLAAAVDGLELDEAAHRQEHAIEVQLPLLARLSPAARVVGITIGGGGFEDFAEMAEQLAGCLGGMSPRPLLVISSDMNHYADEAHTRRVDRLALDALQTLDPRRLYDTVNRERITMCGMAPAVIVMETLRRLGCLNRCEEVGYTTSGEINGQTGRVVGYAGVLLG